MRSPVQQQLLGLGQAWDEGIQNMLWLTLAVGEALPCSTWSSTWTLWPKTNNEEHARILWWAQDGSCTKVCLHLLVGPLGTFHQPEELVPTSFTFLCFYSPMQRGWLSRHHETISSKPVYCDLLLHVVLPAHAPLWGEAGQWPGPPVLETGLPAGWPPAWAATAEVRQWDHQASRLIPEGHLGRSDLSPIVCRSCVNEGTCWVVWPQDLPWRLQGSCSSSQELVILRDCSIKKKKDKNPFLKGPLEKIIFQTEDCCFTPNKELFAQQSKGEQLGMFYGLCCPLQSYVSSWCCLENNNLRKACTNSNNISGSSFDIHLTCTGSENWG